MTLHIFTQNINNFEVAYRANTFDVQKRTVVLVHGIGVSSEYFIPLLEEMSEAYNIFALDLPGYGKTQKPPQPLTIDELSKVLLSFFEEHSLNNVVLVGHSMGCQIVAHAYKHTSSGISKMILMAPTVNHKERSIFLQGFRLFQDTFFEPIQSNIVIFTNYIRMGAIRYLKTARWMVQDRIEDILETVLIPTLIIRGGNDHIVPHNWVQHLETLTDSATTTEVHNAPHAFHHNHPKETAILCKKFIES